MEKKLFFIFVVLFITSAAFAQFEAAKDNETSEGMEFIQVSDGHKVIVPKGVKIQKNGSHLTVEDPTSYIIDKLIIINERLDKLEENLDALKKQVEKNHNEWKLFKEMEEKEDALEESESD